MAFLRLHKKAVYTIITTFFFIMIVVAITIGLIYFTSLISRIKNDVNEDLNKFTVAKNARDAVYYCYGEMLRESNLDLGVCRDNSQFNLPSGLIKAYRITKLDYGSCNQTEWSNINISLIEGLYNDKFVYIVPIQQDNIYTCPGKLEVFI